MAEAAKAMRLVKLKEALRYGAMSKSKLYRLIDAGKIGAYKRGWETMIDLDTIDAYHANLPKLELHRKQA